jgi:hypothetical protein
MARVNLYSDDITEEGSPDVCMSCGEPASVKRVKTFRWNPGWVYLLIIVGLLPFLIVALIMSWQRRVCTPFCDRHAGYWRFRMTFVLGGLLAIVAAIIAVVISAPEDWPAPSWLKATWAGVAIVAFLWLFSAAILQATSIRATEITYGRITLAGVHPAYVAAVRERQDGREAQALDPAVQHKNWPRSQRSEFYDD